MQGTTEVANNCSDKLPVITVSTGLFLGEFHHPVKPKQYGGSSGGGGDGDDIDAVNSGGDDFFLPDSVDAVPVGT